MSARVTVTDDAAAIVRQLREKHGPLLFHQSGGCCDGTAPICLARDDFHLSRQDLELGEIEGCPFYIAADTFEYYRNCRIQIGVTPGRGASFSLEIPLGVRFMTVSKVVSDSELAALPPPRPAT